MQLTDWARTKGYRHADIARQLDVSESAVSKWTSRQRRPSLEMVQRIAVLTTGQVTLDDWYAPPPEGGLVTREFGALVHGETRFGVVLADPPWSFKTYSDKGQGRSASRHYATMSLDEITGLPVSTIAADDAWLFLWTTSAHLPHALKVMAAWKFAFSSIAFTWVKLKRESNGGVGGFDDVHLSLGLTTRKSTELCLLGRHGAPRRMSKKVRELVVAPVREHSRKPDEVIERIQAFASGPYVELFARKAAPGWSAWGNEL